MPQHRNPHTDEIIGADMKDQERGNRHDKLSVYTCPECGGALWEVDDENGITFACHIGHEYGANMLVVAKTHTLNQALSEAVRTLKEKATLLRQLAVKLNPQDETAIGLLEQADQDQEHARFLQSELLEGQPEAPSIDITDEALAQVVRRMRRRTDD